MPLPFSCDWSCIIMFILPMIYFQRFKYCKKKLCLDLKSDKLFQNEKKTIVRKLKNGIVSNVGWRGNNVEFL